MSRLRQDHRAIPPAALAYLLAALVTGMAGDAVASSTGKAGLLPPAIVLFEDQAGTGVKPTPNVDGSSAAAEAVSAAFVAAMATRNVELAVIGKDEVETVDLSRLDDAIDRMALDDAQPFPEVLLSAEYPPAMVETAMGRRQLDAVWVITGIAILPEGGARTPGPAASPTNAPRPGRRLLLRAALVDKQGTVVYSDVVDEGAVAQGERTLEGTTGPGPASVDLRDPQVARRVVTALLEEFRTEREKTDAEQAATRAWKAKAAAPRSPHPAEFRFGLGVFFFASNGVDLMANFLPKNMHWQFGYRYVRWTDTFDDPYTGNELTETTETLHGPQVNYLFRPEKRGTFYVGLSLLRWSSTEVSTVTGGSSSDAVVAPFIGGGYTRHLGKHVYFNTAIFIGPGAQLKTDTGVSSDESSGGFDIQLQIGACF